VTVQTLTLTEFLLARIAEDEAVARHVLAWCKLDVARRPEDYPPGYNPATDSWAYAADGDRGKPVFVVGPARVLAECETRRRIVKMHADDGRRCSSCYVETHDLNQPLWPQASPCLTLRALALPYSDHPHCREEWRR
jgi:hypothetical protein